MTIQEAIQKAVEGGWKDIRVVSPHDIKIDRAGLREAIALALIYQELYDPLFWQALGKSMGWGADIIDVNGKCLHCGIDANYQPPRESGCNHAHYPEACKYCSEKSINWKERWHRLIDHLAEGKSIEDYFKNL